MGACVGNEVGGTTGCFGVAFKALGVGSPETLGLRATVEAKFVASVNLLLAL